MPSNSRMSDVRRLLVLAALAGGTLFVSDIVTTASLDSAKANETRPHWGHAHIFARPTRRTIFVGFQISNSGPQIKVGISRVGGWVVRCGVERRIEERVVAARETVLTVSRTRRDGLSWRRQLKLKSTWYQIAVRRHRVIFGPIGKPSAGGPGEPCAP